jgi:hypothetical protein
MRWVRFCYRKMTLYWGEWDSASERGPFQKVSEILLQKALPWGEWDSSTNTWPFHEVSEILLHKDDLSHEEYVGFSYRKMTLPWGVWDLVTDRCHFRGVGWVRFRDWQMTLPREKDNHSMEERWPFQEDEVVFRYRRRIFHEKVFRFRQTNLPRDGI